MAPPKQPHVPGVWMLIEIPKGLHRALKIRAAEERVTLRAAALQAMAAYVRQAPTSEVTEEVAEV